MRDEEFTLIGRNPVIEAFRAGKAIDRLFVQDGLHDGPISTILREAKKAGVKPEFVKKERLDEIAGQGASHQGVAAYLAAFHYSSVQEMLDAAHEKNEDPFLFILDGIEDPHNLGALIRSANCAGMNGVIIPKRRSAGVNGTVAKSSAGAVFTMPIARVPNLASCVRMLKEHGVWIWAAEAGGKPYYEQDFKCACALILGSEGEGVSEILKKESDFLAGIPMYGSINSLNVSAAGAIVMFEAARQRNNG